MPFHAGLDWGGASHAACIVDQTGRIVARLDVRHDASGLGDMAVRLQRIAPPAELPIAIERPSGLIVDALLAAGHPVIPIHPNVVKACRPRYRAAGGKSDPGDAYMLADILRTDGHRFRPLMVVSDEIKALRALVRGRDDLIAQRVALANQLRSLLEGFWPGATAIFAAIDSPIALDFIGRYPTPDSASRLGEKRLASFLVQHAYSGRRSAAELLARLRAAPTGLASDAETAARGEIVRALVGVLERLILAIAKLSSRIEQAVAQLPDGRIVMSFPRAGRINAPSRACLVAQILAELGDVRERFPTEDQLAAEAGVCPVTHAFRQKPRRRLPIGLQQEPAVGSHMFRGQLPPCLRMGHRHLPKSPSAWVQARPRGAYPGPRLGTRPLESLAGRQTLRPSSPRRCRTHHLSQTIPRFGCNGGFLIASRFARQVDGGPTNPLDA
jgi:transposase